MNKTLVEGRNAYAYCPIGLISATKLEKFSDWAKIYKPVMFSNSLELDQHHTARLCSDKNEEIILGIYSVMYWGYLTSGTKSTTRCNWLSNGNAKNSDLSLRKLGETFAVVVIQRCKELVKAGNLVEALKEICKLPHVGASFGTKYLAFIEPENVGVLDNKILRHLSSGTFNQVIPRAQLDKLDTKNPGKRFQAFCLVLKQIQASLNENKLGWNDVTGAKLDRFRAIDVERALFAMAIKADAA